ncbi:Bulb-type lectin domain-containing protein [Heracleum sosnowskyi]|uniref:Bulb-type lectin domain-containing protein n=1 Tax=Heracleum sosnowskyi TaxID=360622 RepID=A0AAD8HRC9_9APIA|nr:Bulb-type lectin domain-containing protein [Heracleum sosnowskyi]
MATSLKFCMLVVLLVLTSNLGLHVSAKEALFTNQALNAGDQLSKGAFTLVMQGDCNLVLLDTSVPVWSTGTNRRDSNCYAIMQGDGNLVIYKIGQGAVWASNTVRGNDKYALILQGDRNLVIYKGAARNAIWASNTVRGLNR